MHTRAFCFEIAEAKPAASPRPRSPPHVVHSVLINFQKHTHRFAIQLGIAMGWTYNTADNVANDGPLISMVAIVLTALSLAMLLLRFYVRGYMIKAVGVGKLFLSNTRTAQQH
jgi:hypothetical protein